MKIAIILILLGLILINAADKFDPNFKATRTTTTTNKGNVVNKDLSGKIADSFADLKNKDTWSSSSSSLYNRPGYGSSNRFGGRNWDSDRDRSWFGDGSWFGDRNWFDRNWFGDRDYDRRDWNWRNQYDYGTCPNRDYRPYRGSFRDSYDNRPSWWDRMSNRFGSDNSWRGSRYAVDDDSFLSYLNPTNVVNRIRDSDFFSHDYPNPELSIRNYFKSDWLPSVDVKEDSRTFLILLDVPGVKKESLKLKLEDTKLVVQGERINERERLEDHRSEIKYGRFIRSFNLPDNADVNSLKARFNSGVLEITIPKLESAGSGRNINID